MDAGAHVTLSDTVLYEKNIGVAWIPSHRPERMNALNAELRIAMSRAVRDASEDMGVNVVILTGSGSRAFSAGNNLRALSEANPSA